ncbi:uncharacterized protein [Parasteatoda tepidariorum]|nr:uncharacterized protein LOC107447101 isoform X2 [Parasteatoda tepidariorum]XP_015917403.1 uncharacterized protein LOC107447101 isoform X2 [Parasteatoda tepidariorum]XP_015917405.1 uncharacterized protein LOC107447101 isoform X2 [Parasteatoda tepidariorum]
MQYFELVKRNVLQDNFDLVEFLQAQSPHTPIHEELCVGMKEFQVDTIRNGVIYNLFQQGLHLKPETCRQVIVFLKDDFSDLTKRTYVQVLLHMTKTDICRIYEKYSENFDRFPKDGKLSLDEYFDRHIATFVEAAQEQTHTPSEVVGIISHETKQLILGAMLTDPVMSAFDHCLNGLLKLSCTRKWIEKEIEGMQIYSVDRFNPMVGFRGACLVNGILLCTNGLGGGTGTKKREADLITLAAHVCTCYLERLNNNNFNFSSPFAFLCHQSDVRHDLVYPEKLHFEAGRTVELLLFDMIQPDWQNSSNHAAETFLERLKASAGNWPVINKDEQKNLGLQARPYPSLAFGIDVNEECDTFC